ncbi:MAG: TetR/AcrR family transcriptional regulator [Flavobacteriales bacterium]|nr:TetR/AcrR family transcriptional regulator [Flavobacteriales bacterium]
MEEKESKIIEAAIGIFMRFGIKSVNMADIAAQLGISKKTLYKYVSDKADLVKRAMEYHCDLEDKQLKEIAEKNLNAIDESFEVMRMVMNMVKDIHPSVLFDIQKYHPEIKKSMEEDRHKIIYDHLTANMEKGMKEGVYRDDIHPDIVASLYVNNVEAIFHKLTFVETEYSFATLYRELFRLHIRGIASAKGIKYLVEKMKQESNTKQ